MNWPSCGLTLKKYFNPLSVNAGDDEEPLTKGIPALSETKLAVAVTPEKYAPKRACTF